MAEALRDGSFHESRPVFYETDAQLMPLETDVASLLILAKYALREGRFDKNAAIRDLSIVNPDDIEKEKESENAVRLTDTICAVNVGVHHGLDPSGLLPKDFVDYFLGVTGRNAKYDFTGDLLDRNIVISSVLRDLEVIRPLFISDPKYSVLTKRFIDSVIKSMSVYSFQSRTMDQSKKDPFNPNELKFLKGGDQDIVISFDGAGSLQIPVRIPFGLCSDPSSREDRRLFVLSTKPRPDYPERNLSYCINWVLLTASLTKLLEVYSGELLDTDFYQRRVVVDSGELKCLCARDPSRVRLLDLNPHILPNGFWRHQHMDYPGDVKLGKVRELFRIAATDKLIRLAIVRRQEDIARYRNMEMRVRDGTATQYSLF